MRWLEKVSDEKYYIENFDIDGISPNYGQIEYTIIVVNKRYVVLDDDYGKVIWVDDTLEDCLAYLNVVPDYCASYALETLSEYITYKYIDIDTDRILTNKKFDDIMDEFDDLYISKVEPVITQMKQDFEVWKKIDKSTAPKKVKNALWHNERFEGSLGGIAYWIEDCRTYLKKNHKEYHDFIANNFANKKSFREYEETLYNS